MLKSSILVLLSLLALAVGFLSYSSKTPPCINSRYISSITWKKNSLSSEKEVFYQCRLRKSAPYQEKYIEQLSNISQRLINFERIIDSLGGLNNEVEIVVFENQPNTSIQEKNQIYIDQELFLEEGHLERNLLLTYLNGQMPDISESDRVLKESLADLLFYIAKGSFKIFDPYLKSEINLDQVSHWPFLLESEISFQKSPWRLRDNNSEDSESIDILSLRPLLTTVLIESFVQLDGKEQIFLLRYLPSFFSKIQLSNSGERSDHFSELIHKLEAYKKVLCEEPLPYGRNFRWHQLVQNAFEKRGIKQISTVVKLDFLFYFEAEESHPQFFNIINSEVGFIEGSSFYLANRKKEFPKSWFSAFQAKQGILTTCEIPPIRKIMQLSEEAESLLIVKNCEGTNVSWVGLINDGIQQFAKENPNIEFVQMHLPSMRLVLQQGSLNPIVLLATKAWSNPFFHDIGWSQPEYDEQLNLFRAKAAIDAVQYFRLGTNL